MEHDSSRTVGLPAAEGIRRRAHLYVGPLDDPRVPNGLLHEALCCARDAALLGECTRVHVRLDHDGRALVRDDGPGLPLDVDDDGLRVAERWLTEPAASAAGKSTDVAPSTCKYGLAVLNALCAELALRIFADGAEWRQTYDRGVPRAPLAVHGATTERGTELAFVLDPAVLPVREFDLHALVAWVVSDVRRLEVRIDDARSGVARVLRAR